MISFNRYQFIICFPDIPSPLVDVWLTIASFLKSERCLPKRFDMSQIAGHREEDQSREHLKLNAEEIAELIRRRNLDGFQVTSGRSPSFLDFFLLNGKNLNSHSFLWCGAEQRAKAPDDWRRLIEALTLSFPSIGGWQWNGLYQTWQGLNRTDTGYEQRYGTIPPGYRSWHEPGLTKGDPGKRLIDVSLNPGRHKELAFKVYFYPTAEMWLGPHFWPYAKCTKEEAMAADFFIEKRDTPHYLYLKCWPEAFTRPDGEQGRMQQRLWKLFFHEDCEWPPGSGTICDEPMYGPPELMPSYGPT
jgi:hypothetical protein